MQRNWWFDHDANVIVVKRGTLRREAHGLDEIFLAKQQHEKETQELEEEIEAVHRRVRCCC